jgi:iron complex transport system ATP-binding protein
VLNCLGISLTYPGRAERGKAPAPALSNASCAIVPGAITVLVGPNGAGKSTLLRVLAGVRRPDAGRVELAGRDLSALTARDRARAIALVAQQPSVAFDFDARRVIAFGAEGAGRPARGVDLAIERFDLGPIAGSPFGVLSVGQRQRVSLARAWAQLDTDAPGYLLADEPVSAMDPAFGVRALQAMRDLADRGAGVALVLHDLTAAARVADRAVLIDARGRTIAEGDAAAVLTAQALSDLYGTPIVRADPPGVGPVLIAAEPSPGQANRSAPRPPSPGPV